MNVFELTNCPKSLSGVIRYVIKPNSSALTESVPIKSSASYPSRETTGIFSAANSFLM